MCFHFKSMSRLSFSLLQSSIQCIRGARSNQGHAIHLPPSIELKVSESMIHMSTLKSFLSLTVKCFLYIHCIRRGSTYLCEVAYSRIDDQPKCPRE